ncbi:MAG: hypothetical protein JST43_08950 [Bacteroidetes bacterium]|nr:hypothetical protein [Bacteroidota bacterium]MBS1539470.1 hypothetical protein [Bacteroidota bacterium]
MMTNYTTLADDTRVWVYQSNRQFSDAEKEQISETLTSFCHEWNAHGNPLHNYFEIRENRFIILMADESHLPASGCSIDSSTRVLKKLQQHLHLDFFDRTRIAFFMEGAVKTYSLNEIKIALGNGTVGSAAILFNTTVSTKKELEEAWKIPVEKSWLSKYLPEHTLSQ